MLKRIIKLVFVLQIIFLNTAEGQVMETDNRFQIKAGWGYCPNYYWTEMDIYVNNNSYIVDLTEMLPVSDRFTVNPISVEALYRVFRRWEVGAGINYNQMWQKFDKGKISTHFTSFEAIVRYNIVDRDIIKFYAGCLAGSAQATQIISGPEKKIDTEAYLIPAEVFVGASLGKKLFGFCEIGYGAKGAISGGVGYRF